MAIFFDLKLSTCILNQLFFINVIKPSISAFAAFIKGYQRHITYSTSDASQQWRAVLRRSGLVVHGYRSYYVVKKFLISLSYLMSFIRIIQYQNE